MLVFGHLPVGTNGSSRLHVLFAIAPSLATDTGDSMVRAKCTPIAAGDTVVWSLGLTWDAVTPDSPARLHGAGHGAGAWRCPGVTRRDSRLTCHFEEDSDPGQACTMRREGLCPDTNRISAYQARTDGP